MHEDPPCEEPKIGFFSGGKRLAGDVDWAHPKEHLWRVQDEEGQYLLWAPKERRYLLWVPFGRPLREEMLAPARKDICGNYDL